MKPLCCGVKLIKENLDLFSVQYLLTEGLLLIHPLQYDILSTGNHTDWHRSPHSSGPFG